VSFRDDRDALLARADALEAENERLRKKLEEASAPPPPKPEPPEPEPPAPEPPEPEPPKPRVRLDLRRRPRWKVVICLVLTFLYAIVLVIHLVTLAAGDVFEIPMAVYFPGVMLATPIGAWVMPGRGGKPTYPLPRWFLIAAGVQALYAVVMAVLFFAKAVPSVLGFQAIALLFLTFMNVGGWGGEK
jgi:hypothetical protein